MVGSLLGLQRNAFTVLHGYSVRVFKEAIFVLTEIWNTLGSNSFRIMQISPHRKEENNVHPTRSD